MTAVFVNLAAASAAMLFDGCGAYKRAKFAALAACGTRKVTPEDILLRARAKNDYFSVGRCVLC